MRVVTLVSGGLDSTVMSLVVREQGAELFPLFVDYGQLAARQEWSACKDVHRKLGLPTVKRVSLGDFGALVPCGLTDGTYPTREFAFVPGRNLLLALVGAVYAAGKSADGVAMGLLVPPARPFPDQTPRFVEACEAMLEVAVGRVVTILTPLIGFGKRDILVMAQRWSVEGTYSCHAGGAEACGRCIACMDVQRARRRE